jgi:hypothetical protein
MAKVEIKKTSAGGGGGGGNVSFTSVTYAQLVTLIGSSGLVQGDSYLITDFQTIYDQPDFDINGNAQTIVPTLSGAIEPIIVEAVSTSEISNQAFSTVYENDLILYNWAFQGTEINATPAKGIITRRTTDYYNDGRRNSTPYDSRAVLFIRYETVSGSGIYDSYKNTGFASTNVPTFGNNCTSNYIGNFWNTDINAYIMGYPFVLPNTVWGANSSFNKVGDQAFNVTLGDFNCDNNNIGNYFYNNTIGAYFRNNNIQNYFNNNVADENFYNNNIGNYFTQNTSIGSYFRLNTIGNYFYYNVSIGDYFQGNQIGNYFGTDITLDSGIGNTIDYNFASNVIGDFFNQNTVGNDVTNMNIEGYYQSHFIPATTNTKTWVGGLNTGFVNNTDGFLESQAYGLASQYVRGDGQLANFPTSGGGGNSVNYYLNGSVSQGTFGGNAYYQMSKTPVIGAGTDFTINADGFIARFITDAGDPALLNVPSGNWNLEFYFSASSGGGSPRFYVNVYKVSGTTFTLLGTNSTAPEGITNGTTIDAYFTPVSIPTSSLLVTDRLAIDIYVVHSSRTITLHTEDNHLCEIITTFSSGLTALNGLSTQVQYFATGTSGTDFAISSVTDTHTFNLPVASATKTGKLSSTDWSAFNSKLGLYFTEAQSTTAPNATVYVDSLTAVSTTTNADFAIIPKGTGAILRQIPDNTTAGGNKRGANAIDLQYSRTAATQVASGAGSIAMGNNNAVVGLNGIVVGNTNTLSGDNSYVFGQGNTSLVGYDFATAFGSNNAVNRRSSFASGTSNIVTSRDGAAFGNSNTVSTDYSFAFGISNTVSGISSTALGSFCTASASASIALGKGANTGITRSKLSLSSGFEATSGDSQFGIQVLKNRTIGNTATRLYSDSVGAAASTQVYPPLNGAYRFKGTIIGKQTGTLNAAAWDIDGIIVKGATEASVSLLIGNVILVQNTPAWGTPTIAADTATIAGTLNISVTGAATTNIQWVCTVQTTEVIY